MILISSPKWLHSSIRDRRSSALFTGITAHLLCTARHRPARHSPMDLLIDRPGSPRYHPPRVVVSTPCPRPSLTRAAPVGEPPRQPQVARPAKALPRWARRVARGRVVPDLPSPAQRRQTPTALQPLVEVHPAPAAEDHWDAEDHFLLPLEPVRMFVARITASAHGMRSSTRHCLFIVTPTRL